MIFSYLEFQHVSSVTQIFFVALMRPIYLLKGSLNTILGLT